MSNLNELVDELRQRLVKYDFKNHQSTALGQAVQTDIISTNGKSFPKLICAVAPIPSDIASPGQAEDFKQTLRKGLTGLFRGLPRPRRLGSCTVLLGDHKACKALEPHKSLLIDRRGMHINVMFGTIIVDTDTFTTRSDITWGLMDVAEEFSKIQSAVDGWCAQYHIPSRMVQAAGRALKIA
jgi:hypothetical protein